MPDRSQLFADIDSMEPERFTAHLAEDVTMCFGNADPIHGRGSTVTVPVATIWREGDGGIVDYRIFIDLAPLFA